MWAGVGKSGSPAPKPMTSSPAAFSALARASIASVADSSIEPTRCEIRECAMVDFASVADFPDSGSMASDVPEIQLPPELRPADGRFGSGPSKVRQEAVTALAAVAPTYLGTSHRQPTVKNVVRRLREGLTQLFGLPDGYE